ncbi:aspartate carbamoyltransferase [Candidatus Kaiserbacteria bacterium RIFCSPHIGHO2_01_FULL_51_33]|uniref:Aspartate carbamoyltransferase n=1 Tax=Candidatus Kaiserbacteria bacterium RIFCSPLOWO2_01_FULL_51_21 TaxID=1798508 RepID=A0A1F6ECS8_9BACT|nr:MAG: aspartate carbamoyltransferase [Candidatus Kaiserbacteria bacterium RIFCSPHIGHO2_01_FULL_51_33]OGG71474.1 MAG: aspartate carbamoyltransferase [Candidatus Kaiserbacteria bacterium RIFCSPLOWO2_01_FULL_51_21]
MPSKPRHIIKSQQFDRALLGELFSLADRLEHESKEALHGKILACLFYEPSTRTRFSFETAMLRQGGRVIVTENAHEFSSAAKGETLEDTIRVVGNYANAIVLRHNKEDAPERAAAVSAVPIINAGAGAGQHPTQALLDLYTINRECHTIDGISIALAGDLKYGRTIRSLAYLLGKFNNVTITFISPPELRVGDDIKAYLKRHRVSYREVGTLEEAIGDVQVLYQTRIQKERFPDPLQYEGLKNVYRVDRTLAERMQKGAIIMHPLPRNDEIAREVDDMPQAAYFRQARYGLFVRMALLRWVFNSG